MHGPLPNHPLQLFMQAELNSMATQNGANALHQLVNLLLHGLY
jgi:hypothetical protein